MLKYSQIMERREVIPNPNINLMTKLTEIRLRKELISEKENEHKLFVLPHAM